MGASCVPEPTCPDWTGQRRWRAGSAVAVAPTCSRDRGDGRVWLLGGSCSHRLTTGCPDWAGRTHGGARRRGAAQPAVHPLVQHHGTRDELQRSGYRASTPPPGQLSPVGGGVASLGRWLVAEAAPLKCRCNQRDQGLDSVETASESVCFLPSHTVTSGPRAVERSGHDTPVWCWLCRPLQLPSSSDPLPHPAQGGRVWNCGCVIKSEQRSWGRFHIKPYRCFGVIF